MIFLNTFRAHDEQRPQKVHIRLYSAEAVHSKMYEMLDAGMLRRETRLREPFAVKKCRVAEAFGNLVDVLKVLARHLV